MSEAIQHLCDLQMQGMISMAQFVAMSRKHAAVLPEPDDESEGGDPASPPQDLHNSAEAPAGGTAEGTAEATSEVQQEEDDDGSCGDEDDEVEEVAAAPAAAAPAAATSKVQINNSILNFISKNTPAAAKVAAPRKPGLETKKRKAGVEIDKVRNVHGRGQSVKKQGTRLNDVKPETLKLRLSEHTGQPVSIKHGQLFCEACVRNVGSGKAPFAAHLLSQVHVENMKRMQSSKDTRSEIKAALHEYKDDIKKTHGDEAFVRGLKSVPEETQLYRAETVEEFLRAGVPLLKIDILRPYLERTSGNSLVGRQHLTTAYLPALKLAEEKRLKDEFKDEFIGVYHDGTTHNGESFAIVYRAVKAGFVFRNSCVRVQFLRGSMKAPEISSLLMKTCAVHMEVLPALPRDCPASLRCPACSTAHLDRLALRVPC